ncbi:MAG: glycosyltransferase family 4 protein [Terracidiphilus sp.]
MIYIILGLREAKRKNIKGGKPLRVAVLHNHPIHYMHLLFSAIASLGVKVDVVFAARTSILRTASLCPKGLYYRSHFLFNGSFESLPQARSAFQAVRVFARLKPDVVIICGYSYLPTWSVLAWAKLSKTPVVLWFESNFFDHPRSKTKELVKQIFVSAFAAAHVYGKSNRDYLEHLGMSPSKILEKRATVDSGLFMRRRANFNAGFRRFVYVGRFSPEKNLLFLLEAFGIARDKCPAELVMAGYGPEEPLLREYVQTAGLGEFVKFAGQKTQDEVSKEMAKSDCLVLPSLSETWGLVVNEALCTGLPVIVSDRCGCARDLARPETGWVFCSESKEELTAAMLEVCGLPLDRLQKMGDAAVKLAAEYTPEACAQRILANLETLIR